MSRSNEVERTLVQIEKLIRQVRMTIRQDEMVPVPAYVESVSAIPDWP